MAGVNGLLLVDRGLIAGLEGREQPLRPVLVGQKGGKLINN